MASVSTDEDIVNIALSRCGNSKSITTLTTDTSAEAVAMRRIYFNARDVLMRGHAWTFLKRRVQLTDSASDPTFGWQEGYLLPSDYLRVFDVLATDSLTHRIPYSLEKQALGTASTTTDVLLCDSSTCFLIYIYKETDPALWTVDFHDALGWGVALEYARSIPLSQAKIDGIKKEVAQAILTAKNTGGIENWPELFPPGTWLTDRWRTDEGNWQ